MNTVTVLGIAAVPAIAGLVEVCKDLGLPKRAAPAAAVFFGIALGLLQFYSPQLPQGPAAILGAALGLSASGLYSGAGAILGKAPTVPPPAPTPPTPPGPPEPIAIPVARKRTNERGVVRGAGKTPNKRGTREAGRGCPAAPPADPTPPAATDAA